MTWVLLLVALLGSDVQSRETWRARKLLDQLEEVADDGRQLVDMGVVLRVVRRDLENGQRIVASAPPLTVLREHRFGGIVDTRLSPVQFVGASPAPVVWLCSEQQEELLLSEQGRSAVWGAMGSGKTETLSMWTLLESLRLTGAGCELGATAPTMPRAEMVRDALVRRMPESWYRWSERHQLFTLRNDTRIRLVSTHQQSRAEGSRVQGYNWASSPNDEMQDSIPVDGDIEARGRAAPGGNYRRLATITVKDDPDYRSYVDFLKTSGKWQFTRMQGPDNPFTWPAYWDDLKQTMSLREYQRKVLALDVGPESRVYTTWSRSDNLRPVPHVGAVDVTRSELAKYGQAYDVLVGHDPGTLVDYSVLLKAYRLATSPTIHWWVVDEVATNESTTEQHGMALLKRLRERWSCNTVDHKGRRDESAGCALIHADPYGNTDAKTDRSVYTTLRQCGLDVRPAAFSVNGSGPGRVPKDAGIEMVVRLLCDAAGRRRLFVGCDDRRQPVAPMLVESLERSERDAAGQAETQKKRKGDLSHPTAGLRYALWTIERPRIGRVAA